MQKHNFFRDEEEIEMPKKKRKYNRCNTLESRKDVLPPCVSKSGRKGCTKSCLQITAERRKEINENFWSMSYDARSAWIAQSVETIKPLRPRSVSSGLKERSVTRVFSLSTEGRVKIRVCQKMFLTTLGLKKDKIIETALKKTSESQLQPYSDQRGRKIPANKKSDDVIACVKAHI